MDAKPPLSSPSMPCFGTTHLARARVRVGVGVGVRVRVRVRA